MDRRRSGRKRMLFLGAAACLTVCAGLGVYSLKGCLAVHPPDEMPEGGVREKEEICERAAVRIACGMAAGNGVIIRAKEEEYVLVTAAHVTGGEPDQITVCGVQAEKAEYYISEEYDLAFVKFRLPDPVDGGTPPVTEIAAADLDFAAYDALEDGDEIRLFGFLGDGSQWYTGKVLCRWIYMEDFGYHMLWGRMEHMQGGLSGSGVYDGEGRLVGILCGGGGEDEIAVLPVNIIEAQWQRALKYIDIR